MRAVLKRWLIGQKFVDDLYRRFGGCYCGVTSPRGLLARPKYSLNALKLPGSRGLIFTWFFRQDKLVGGLSVGKSLRISGRQLPPEDLEWLSRALPYLDELTDSSPLDQWDVI
jgi:hypothetical protein